MRIGIGNRCCIVAGLLALLATPPALAQDRLVTVFGPQEFSRSTPSKASFSAPSTEGRWFLTVERNRLSDLAFAIELNGQRVLGLKDFLSPTRRTLLRVEVPIQATNLLQVQLFKTPKKHKRGKKKPGTVLTVTVQGVVPESALPAGQGDPVAFVPLFSQRFERKKHSKWWGGDDEDEETPPGCGKGKHGDLVEVPVPSTEGLFTLKAERVPSKTKWKDLFTFARVHWNDERVFSPVDFALGRKDPSRLRAPVAVVDTNLLCVRVLGLPGAAVDVELEGFVVDREPPRLEWVTPSPGAVLDPDDSLELSFGDDTSAILPGSLEVLMNGVDVTPAFQVSETGASATVSALPLAAFVVGTNALEATILDQCHNQAEANTSFKVRGPQVTTPGDLVVECSAPAGTPVGYVVTVADEDDPDAQVACEPDAGNLFQLGVTQVTCTGTNKWKGQTVESFAVTVQDTTPPTLVGIADLTTEATSALGAAVGYVVSASDACDPAPVVVCAPSPGTTFPLGDTAVVCTASDASGNEAQATFTVHVVDTTPPTLEQPADQTVECAGPSGTVVSYSLPQASDLVDPTPNVACAPPSGAAFALGETAVVCTASDSFGNASQVTFRVIVQDTIAPVLSGVPADISIVASDQTGAVVVFSSPSAADLCDPSPQVVCSPASGSVFPIGTTTVTCTATDASGNQTQASFQVVVEEPPPVPVDERIEISLIPGPAAALPAGSVQRVRLRARDARGATDPSFEGVVELSTTDPRSPLNGLMIMFTAQDAGVIETPPLVPFLSVGTQSLTATQAVPGGDVVVGRLVVQVVPGQRGNVFLLLQSGAFQPGDEIEARVMVDMGPDDCDVGSFSDVLGLYEVRLLFNEQVLEVASVTSGSSPLGEPLFVLQDSLRLMDLNDQGTLANPQGPDPVAMGLLEVAVVTFRVLGGAPAGGTPVSIAVDALASAAPADVDGNLESVGATNPRFGSTVGQISVVSQDLACDLRVLGGVPRAEEVVVGPLQFVEVLFSHAPDPSSLVDRFKLVNALTGDVAGTLGAGHVPQAVRFTADEPLVNGDYAVVLEPSIEHIPGCDLGDQIQLAFQVGSLPTAGGDLNGDGEVTPIDFAFRRDLLTGRTSGGPPPNFPPVFTGQFPVDLTVNEGEVRSQVITVRDPEGQGVALVTSGVDFVFPNQLSDETFELVIAPGFEDAELTYSVALEASDPDGNTASSELRVLVKNVNRPPSLEPLDPPRAFLRVKENEFLTFSVQAFDPDLTDPQFPDALTFSPVSLPRLDGPQVSGEVAVFTFSPTFDEPGAGVHEVVIEVRDREQVAATLTVSIEVVNENREPTLKLKQPLDPTKPTKPLLVNLREETTFVYEVTDDDGIGPDEKNPLSIVLTGDTQQRLEALQAEGQVAFSTELERFPESGQQGDPARAELTVTFTWVSNSTGLSQLGLVAEATDGEELAPETPVLHTAPRGIDFVLAGRQMPRPDFVPLITVQRPTPTGVEDRLSGTLNLVGFNVGPLERTSLAVPGFSVVSDNPPGIDGPTSLALPLTATISHTTSLNVIYQTSATFFGPRDASPANPPQSPVVVEVDGNPFTGQTVDVGLLVDLKVRIPDPQNVLNIHVFDPDDASIGVFQEPGEVDLQSGEFIVTPRVVIKPTTQRIGVRSILDSQTQSDPTFVPVNVAGPDEPVVHIVRIAHRAGGPRLEAFDPLQQATGTYILPRDVDLTDPDLSTGINNPFVYYFLLDATGEFDGSQLELVLFRESPPVNKLPTRLLAMSNGLQVQQTGVVPFRRPKQDPGDPTEETQDYWISPPILMALRAKPQATLDPYLDLPGGAVGISLGAPSGFFIEDLNKATEPFPRPGTVLPELLGPGVRVLVPGPGGNLEYEAQFTGPVGGSVGFAAFTPGFASGGFGSEIPLDFAVTKAAFPQTFYPAVLHDAQDPQDILVETVLEDFEGNRREFPELPPLPPGIPPPPPPVPGTAPPPVVGFNRLRHLPVLGKSIEGAPEIKAEFLLYADEEETPTSDIVRGVVIAPVAEVIEIPPGPDLPEGTSPDLVASGRLALFLDEDIGSEDVPDDRISRYLRENRLPPIGVLRSLSLLEVSLGVEAVSFPSLAEARIRESLFEAQGVGELDFVPVLTLDQTIVAGDKMPPLLHSDYKGLSGGGGFARLPEDKVYGLSHTFSTQVYPALGALDLFRGRLPAETPQPLNMTVIDAGFAFKHDTRDFTSDLEARTPLFLMGKQLFKPRQFELTNKVEEPKFTTSSTGDMSKMLSNVVGAEGGTASHGATILALAGGDGVGTATNSSEIFVGFGQGLVYQPIRIHSKENRLRPGSVVINGTTALSALKQLAREAQSPGVVNISFGKFKQSLTGNDLANWRTRYKAVFRDLVKRHPDAVLVISAGNGTGGDPDLDVTARQGGYLWAAEADNALFQEGLVPLPVEVRIEAVQAALSPPNFWNRAGKLPPRVENWQANVVVVGSVVQPDRNELSQTDPTKVHGEAMAPSSNFGHHVSLVAPATRVRRLDQTGAVPTAQGTSYAAPQVAAAIAQVMRIRGMASPDGTLRTPRAVEAIRFVEQTADPLTHPLRKSSIQPSGLLTSGHGRLNFWKAVLSAANGGLAIQGGGLSPVVKARASVGGPLPLVSETATRFYGFEIRSKRAVRVKLVKEDQSDSAIVYGPGASRPDLGPDIGATEVVTYQGVNGPPFVLMDTAKVKLEVTTGKEVLYSTRPSLPVGIGPRGSLLVQFTAERADLGVPGSSIKFEFLDGQGAPLVIPLDFLSIRKAPTDLAAGNLIRKHVRFDDFVVYIDVDGFTEPQ